MVVMVVMVVMMPVGRINVNTAFLGIGSYHVTPTVTYRISVYHVSVVVMIAYTVPVNITRVSGILGYHPH